MYKNSRFRLCSRQDLTIIASGHSACGRRDIRHFAAFMISLISTACAVDMLAPISCWHRSCRFQVISCVCGSVAATWSRQNLYWVHGISHQCMQRVHGKILSVSTASSIAPHRLPCPAELCSMSRTPSPTLPVQPRSRRQGSSAPLKCDLVLVLTDPAGLLISLDLSRSAVYLSQAGTWSIRPAVVTTIDFTNES